MQDVSSRPASKNSQFFSDRVKLESTLITSFLLMGQFSGDTVFPFPSKQVAERFANAGFLANCVPGANVLFADLTTARWVTDSPFRFTRGSISTELILAVIAANRIRFNFHNSLVGGTVEVLATLSWESSESTTEVIWVAEVLRRTGVAKIVPESVLIAQTRSTLRELWKGVLLQWDHLPTIPESHPGLTSSPDSA
jgi:carbon monoxide dehydrogenase subunit G